MITIHVLEDDKKIASHLQTILEAEGFIVNIFSSIDELINSKESTDLLILDRLIGNKDTKDFFSIIHQKYEQATFIILSAINTSSEKAEFLNLGADDYLGKPFSSNELISRVRAVLRRNNVSKKSFVQCGNVILDTENRKIIVENKNEVLPAKEFLVLKLLFKDPDKIWSKPRLLDIVWESDLEVESNVVETTVANIRKRLLYLDANISIKNQRNVGYWIES